MKLSLSPIVFFILAIATAPILAESCYNDTQEVDAREAYCFYYSSSKIAFDYTTVFLNATSNNVFLHATLWVNSELKVGGHKLADCEPHDGDDNTCCTSDEMYSYENNDGTSMYVLLCLECHYWLDDCDVDKYQACLDQEAQQGYVTCPECL